jgi:hypothetical protein
MMDNTAAGITLQALAAALGGEVSVSGDQVLCPGPGHSPKDRSLSIKLDCSAPDGFVVNSFAGDDAIDCKDYVRDKAGLAAWQPKKGNGRANSHRSMDDEIDAAIAGAAPTAASTKAPIKTAAAKRTWDCNYDYRDLEGRLIYQVQRWKVDDPEKPKEFSQRRPNGNGGWIDREVFKGISRIPYHYPELATEMSTYPDAQVFCTEGEKDCDNVRALGLFATCVAGSVWTPEIAAVLKGRDVIITEDNDKAGREKAAKAGQALAGIANSVRIVRFTDLPEKGDVSDWIASDPEKHNADALGARCLAAPEWQAGAATPDQSLSLGEWDAGDDDQIPPPRGWLLGNIFCRQFVSSLLGDGGVGKTAVRYAQLISLATGRSLTGEHVFQRCRVLIVSLEDGVDELRRRIKAVLIHHGIELSELKGWLFLAAPGAAAGKLMALDPRGRPVTGGLAAKLASTITARKIDIVSLDPFIKTHSVEENSNSAIDDVVQILSGMSITHNMAVDTPHHMSKGAPDPGNANRGRGASSAKDGGRLVYTLTSMTTDEAQAFGLSEAERRRLVRMDSGKVNIAPPADKATWFRLVGVRIDNGTELYPNGDEVQTVEPWTPPETFAGLTNLIANQILNDIDAGLPDGNRYSDASSAGDRAAWQIVVNYIPEKKEAAARDIIKTWKKSGLLTARDYGNPVTRKTVKGLYVDNAKRPS